MMAFVQGMAMQPSHADFQRQLGVSSVDHFPQRENGPQEERRLSEAPVGYIKTNKTPDDKFLSNEESLLSSLCSL